jgi:dTDP-L-rhamnose 4-epimerase
VDPLPTPEHKPSNPASFYPLTLKQMEEIALLTGETYGIPIAVLRFSKLFGPRQPVTPDSEDILSATLFRLLSNESPVIHEDGEQTRDFLPVSAAVDALELVMEKPEADFQVFNIGSGQPRTVKEIIKIIGACAGTNLRPESPGRFRKWSPRHLHPDTTKAKLLLRYKPQVDFEESLVQTVQWYRTTLETGPIEQRGAGPQEMTIQ